MKIYKPDRLHGLHTVCNTEVNLLRTETYSLETKLRKGNSDWRENNSNEWNCRKIELYNNNLKKLTVIEEWILLIYDLYDVDKTTMQK